MIAAFWGAQVCAQSHVPSDSTLDEVLVRAYSVLKAGLPEAQSLFEKASKLDPSNVLVHKQLGYIYRDHDRTDLAVREFMIADSLQPSDTTKMQIAYWLRLIGRNEESDQYFQRLMASGSPDVRQQAANEYSNRASTPASWYTRIYAAPYYDSRWETWFYSALLQEGHYVDNSHVLSLYGFVSVSGDARSSGGLAPVIFSDNAVVTGLGVKAEPFTGFQASVQEGLSVDLIKRTDQSSTRGDFRAVAVYGNGIYPSYTYHPDVQFPFAPLLDFYSSLGYYSRYSNTIGYLQGRAGIRTVEVSRAIMDAYVSLGVVRDGNKEYYNNLVEGSVGVRISPNIFWGLYLAGEFHRGSYWDVGGTARPYDQFYSSFRFFIILDKTF